MDLYGKVKSIYSCVYGERSLGGSQRDAVYAFFMRNLSAAQLHHAADAAPGSLHDVLRQGDFLTVAAL